MSAGISVGELGRGGRSVLSKAPLNSVDLNSDSGSASRTHQITKMNDELMSF